MVAKDKKYVSAKDQCWLKACKRQACMFIIFKGERRHVCSHCAVTYGSSKERDG